MKRDLLLAHTYIWLEVLYCSMREALSSGDQLRIVTAEHLYAVAANNWMTIGGILPEITV